MNRQVDARTRVGAGQTKQERSGITRARLIAATEKLVAEWGIEAVNLRDVGREAEQHNNSVVQYHFGTKEFLVDSVIAARLPDLDAQYRSLLDQPTGKKKEPTALATLVVHPLAELARSEEARPFLGFLASMLTAPHWRPLLEDRPELIEMFELLAAAVTAAGVPADRAASRVHLAWELAVVALASERGDLHGVIAEVTDAIAGIVGAR
jgi:AcrR family transcriptional regulator